MSGDQQIFPLDSEDLAPLLTAPQGDPLAIRGGKGTVVSWNAETGDNVIDFRGVHLTNLPIVSASTWVLAVQPGDTVLLHIFGTGGFATVHIVGPITQPGPQIREIIRSTIANNIFSADVSALESTASTSYTNLATGGPTVSNVPIGLSGRALVLVTSLIQANAGTDNAAAGVMSYEISGATSRAPSDAEALRLDNVDFALNTAIITRNTAVSLAEGLTPGMHTFDAKYRSNVSGVSASFDLRNLTVIAF